MNSEDNGLGRAHPVPSSAEKPLASDSQQVEKASLSEVQEEKQHQRQRRLPPDEDSLDEKKDTQDNTPEITSEKDGGRLPTSRQSSSRSLSRTEKVKTPVKDDPAVAAKKQDIRNACVQGDFTRLRKLADSEGGFLTDELRQIACKFF